MYNASRATKGQADERLRPTIKIVTAYAANNRFPAAELPSLIECVGAVIDNLVPPRTSNLCMIKEPTPSQVQKSITDEALISFINGRSYKTLKRHLAAHGLTPESYRARYRLPDDYPMIAANYAATRSQIAKAIQLGGKYTKYSYRKSSLSSIL